MFVLLGELSFWTFDSDISVKEVDFGAFSYHDKKSDNMYDEGKRSYAQNRGMICVPQNKKGNKLKDSIKYLEDQLKEYTCIYCHWVDYNIVQIMLTSGLITYIQVNSNTGDIQKIIFDKYLVGKLSDRLSDVVMTKNYILCTYNDTQATLVYFLKSKNNSYDKINRLDAKISNFEIYGPSGRRLEKKVEHSRSQDLILIWWKSTMNEVYPWSPTIKEHDRANVHFYRLSGTKFELICYLKTEFDPLCITFHTNYDNVIYSIEQKVSRKGEVTVEWKTYEILQQNKLQRVAVVSIPLPTHTSCIKLSPNQEMLLLCCIDGSMTLHDHVKGTNSTTKAPFIPTLACWHSDGYIFTIGNERGQMQHFDIALNGLKSQILSEDLTPVNIIDLSSYFKVQPAFTKMEWNRRNEINSYLKYCSHGDALLLLFFEKGPLAVTRIIEGENFSGHSLIQRYLSVSQFDQAVLLLLTMNWNLNPQLCIHSLNKIVNCLFKLPLTTERENLIQNALGSFHLPTKPINPTVIDEYGDEVRDLTRRFFHHLLRHRLFETAFRLAIDLNDHDLFMDIYFYALILKDTEMAKAAKDKAEEILSSCNSSTSSHSTCSRDSCSICSDSDSNKEESYSEDSDSYEDFHRKDKLQIQRSNPKRTHKNSNSQAPPLPIIYNPSTIYNSGNNSNLMSTSFNDNNIPETNKTENNLMTTAFNIPLNSTVSNVSYSIPSTSLNNYSVTNFMPNMILPTFPFTQQPTRSFDNLLSPFQSLSTASNNLTPSIAQSSLNSMSLENITSSFKKASLATPLPLSTVGDSKSQGIAVFTNASLDASSINTNNQTLQSSSAKDCDIVNKSLITLSQDQDSKNINGSSVLKNLKPISSSAINPLDYTKGNLMSTSFNDAEDNDETNSNSCDSSNNSTTESKQKISIPPPPPLITDSLANYVYNLPKKNYLLSRSASGLLDDVEKPVLKMYLNAPLNNTPTPKLSYPKDDANLLCNQSSNISCTRKYRLDYDFDYIPFYTTVSCDSVIDNAKINNGSNDISSKHKKVFNHNSISNANREFIKSSNVPPLPVINSSINGKYPSLSSLPLNYGSESNAAGTNNEKPKVKFSDTVTTHILVPNSNQGYRPPQKKISQLLAMDPTQKELAESLPLCLGNEDYLKNFQPLSKEECDKPKDEPAKIRVVHFGPL